MGIFKFMSAGEARPSGAKGYRAYVIGDVHGRLDLLDQLLGEIERDRAARQQRKTLLVFLGDLIDRGAQSAQVIERLRHYAPQGVQTAFLLGNHEEVLLRILEGDATLIPSWLRFGGAECMESYGADPAQLSGQANERALATVRATIPHEHKDFLSSFSDTLRFGDYLFVHAGIRPGVSLDHQLQEDLRWIRDPFLMDETDHGCVVVHGHTITPKVEERRNRIGIDTGAYRTGILTALALEGAHRWYLDTGQSTAA